MKKFLVVLSLLSLSLPALAQALVEKTTTSKRPQTRAELLTVAMSAIRAKDVSAYMALYPTMEETKLHCPEMISAADSEDMIADMHKMGAVDAAEGIAYCHKVIDFSKAVQIEQVKKSERDPEPSSGCNNFFNVEDIKVYFKIGEKRYKVRIDGPFMIGADGFAIGDKPRCSEVEPFTTGTK
jgi:hypothetical protein